MKLTRFESRWAEAAIGAIFPGSREEGLADICAMDVAGFLARVMRCIPFQVALGLRAAVWLVALAPLLVLGRFATITGLTVSEREALVVRLVASESYAIRSLVLILKTMGALLYAGDDGVRRRMFRSPPPPSIVPLRRKRIHAA
jgi:hypothetical protein